MAGVVLQLQASDIWAVLKLIIMQVIHHLDKPGTNGYPNIKKFVEEAYRVMKPGGVFVINTCSPDQYQPPVLWYYSLIPNFHKQLCQRYVLY